MTLVKAFVGIVLLYCGTAPLQGRMNIYDDTGHFPHLEVFNDPRLFAIGRIAVDGEDVCDATLIAEDAIVTAAHCLFDDAGHYISLAMMFRPGNGVKPIEIVTATPLTHNYTFLPERDVAFARLARPISAKKIKVAKVASIATLHPEDNDVDLFITAIFLNSNYALNEHWATERCNAKHLFTGSLEFTHNCSTTPGMSGAALYTLQGSDLIVIGIHNGANQTTHDSAAHFSEALANRAVEGTVLADAFERFQKGELKPDIYCDRLTPKYSPCVKLEYTRQTSRSLPK